MCTRTQARAQPGVLFHEISVSGEVPVVRVAGDPKSPVGLKAYEGVEKMYTTLLCFELEATISRGDTPNCAE